MVRPGRFRPKFPLLSDLTSRTRDQDGFTLIELLIVVVLIGILAAIAIPAFLSQRSKSQDAAAKSTLNTAAKAAQAYYVDHDDSYATMTIDDLKGIEPSLADAGALKAAVAVLSSSSSDFTVYAQSRSGKYHTYTRTSGVAFRCSSSGPPTSACSSSSW